jgi:ABC-type transport system involved in multi-copper enzyme maturation permease subunit
MYFRKCWRDVRAFLLLYAFLAVSGALFAVLPQAAVAHPEGGWSIVTGGSPQRIISMWNGGLTVLALFGIFLGVMAGLGLGASGVGGEFPRGSLEYLFTRPRARRYFLWTGWLAGMSQLAITFLLYTLVGVLALLYVCGSLQTWRIVLLVPLSVTSAAVTFGLTCFLTVLCRDGRLGLNLSLGLVGAWLVAAIYLYVYHLIKLPFVWNMLVEFPGRDPQGAIYGWVPFPLARVILWWVVALALPAAAQPILERSDA